METKAGSIRSTCCEILHQMTDNTQLMMALAREEGGYYHIVDGKVYEVPSAIQLPMKYFYLQTHLQVEHAESDARKSVD